MSVYKCPRCGYEFAWIGLTDPICICGHNLRDYSKASVQIFSPAFTNENREEENRKIVERLRKEGKLKKS